MPHNIYLTVRRVKLSGIFIETKNKKMRQVEFQEWIKIEYLSNGKRKDGTGVYSKEYTGKGLFHQWGQVHYDGDDNGVATDTMAIIELEDGKITLVEPMNVRFIDKH